jgi:hypothetical protein
MIDACITTLMQGRLFENDIYTEKFFSAADAQQVRSPLFKRVRQARHRGRAPAARFDDELASEIEY